MTWRQQIEQHYQDVWNVSGQPCPFALGPIHELPAGFEVKAFPPHGNREMWTYATCCMSTSKDALPIELHVFSENRSDELVELLTVTAHYHRTSAPLGLWHTVNFGKPWQPGSQCDYGLISLPYLDGPALENLEVPGASLLKFYWLVPITKAEVEFKKQNGIESLEQTFEREAFNYLDPLRASVV